jgi:hypothetical protein
MEPGSEWATKQQPEQSISQAIGSQRRASFKTLKTIVRKRLPLVLI